MTGEIAEGLQEVIDRRREPLFSLLRQTYCQCRRFGRARGRGRRGVEFVGEVAEGGAPGLVFGGDAGSVGGADGGGTVGAVVDGGRHKD
jgi:hypothetical protein